MSSFAVGLIAGVVALALWLLYGRGSSRALLRELRQHDSGDALADADRRLAYGQYKDADRLVREALRHDPTNPDLVMKLIEILFVWGRPTEFQSVIDHHEDLIRAQGEWEKIVIMGAQLCPTDPRFQSG